MTPLDKLASTALSSKAQAFAVGVGAVLAIDAQGEWRVVAVVLMTVGYMFARAWEDRGRVVPAQAAETPPTETGSG